MLTGTTHLLFSLRAVQFAALVVTAYITVSLACRAACTEEGVPRGELALLATLPIAFLELYISSARGLNFLIRVGTAKQTEQGHEEEFNHNRLLHSSSFTIIFLFWGYMQALTVPAFKREGVVAGGMAVLFTLYIALLAGAGVVRQKQQKLNREAVILGEEKSGLLDCDA